MEQITRYRIPIFTGVGALILAIVVYMAWISPEGGKVSSLKAQQTQLQSQQVHLQAQLSTLKGEKAHLAANCQAAHHGPHRDPGHAHRGRLLPPGLGAGRGGRRPQHAQHLGDRGAGRGRGHRDVAVALTLSGTYGQMTSFLQGLNTFPRLFT